MDRSIHYFAVWRASDFITRMLILPFTAAILLSVSAVNGAQPSAAQSNETPLNFKPKKNQDVPRDIDSQCLDCICQQESVGCNHTEGCNPDPDANHMACGPFQIHSDYFTICCSLLAMGNCHSDSAFRACALDYNCAVRCVTVCGVGGGQGLQKFLRGVAHGKLRVKTSLIPACMTEKILNYDRNLSGSQIFFYKRNVLA